MALEILIEPTELNALIARSDIAIVDTREPQAYAEGHIPGAVNIHEIFSYLSKSTPEGLAELREKFAELFGAAGIDRMREVVFYEQNLESGYGQSPRGHFLLAYLGNANSKVLNGGLDAWIEAGLPLTDEVPMPEPRAFPLTQEGADLMLTKEDILSQLGKDEVTLLDVRDVDEWIGASSSPYGADFAPRKGRIPGAKWLEWYRMMKPTPAGRRIKGPAEVLAETQSVGIDKNKPVWLYCFKGARTSNTYVALKQAGFEKVAMYFGSWNEWSRDPSLPIEEGFPAAA